MRTKNIGHIALFIFALVTGFATKGQNQDYRAIELKSILSRAKTKFEIAGAHIELAHHYIVKPGAEVNDMSTARFYLRNAREINRLLQSELVLGNILFEDSQIEKETGNRGVGLEKLNEAILLFKKVNASGREGRSLMELRYYFGLEGEELQKRIAIVKQAALCFVRSKEKAEEGGAYMELGDLYSIKGEPAEAILALRKTVSLYNESNFQNLQSVYNLLGNVYVGTGDLENALHYGHLAVKELEEAKDTSFVAATTYNRLAITYSRLGLFDKTLEYLQKALVYAMKNKWDDGVAEIASNIAEASIKLGSKIEPHIDYLENYLQKTSKNLKPRSRHFAEGLLRQFYIQLGDAQKSQYYLNRTLRFEFETDITDRVMMYRDAVMYYTMVGNTTESTQYLKKFEDLTRKVSNPKFLELYYTVAYKTDSSQGRFREAFENHRLYKQYSDSTNTKISKREIRVMTAKFDLEKKDAEIKHKSENIVLLQKNIKTQNELLRRSNTIRNITILAVIILFLLLLSLYSRWKINRRYSNSIAKKNYHLEQLLQEKEWLVREVHHRVKNNLQMITSLIDSQVSYLNDDAFEAVMASKHRIEAMSLLHQKLYLSQNIGSINMKNYIEELMAFLKDSFGPKKNINFILDLEEIQLDISNAIPIGLILNEAATNAIKYAFPSNQLGKVEVKLECDNNENIVLSISDNGIGLDPDFNTEKAQSLGMNLMYGLATEVSGKLTIDGTFGTTVSLNFKYPKPFSEQPDTLSVSGL